MNAARGTMDSGVRIDWGPRLGADVTRRHCLVRRTGTRRGHLAIAVTARTDVGGECDAGLRRAWRTAVRGRGGGKGSASRALIAQDQNLIAWERCRAARRSSCGWRNLS